MARHREGRRYSILVSHDGLCLSIYSLIITALVDGAVATDAVYVSGDEIKRLWATISSIYLGLKITSHSPVLRRIISRL